ATGPPWDSTPPASRSPGTPPSFLLLGTRLTPRSRPRGHAGQPAGKHRDTRGHASNAGTISWILPGIGKIIAVGFPSVIYASVIWYRPIAWTNSPALSRAPGALVS